MELWGGRVVRSWDRFGAQLAVYLDLDRCTKHSAYLPLRRSFNHQICRVFRFGTFTLQKKTGQSDQPLPGKDRKHRASSSNSLWQHKREEKRAVCIRFTECTYGQSSALSFVAFPSLLSLSFSLLLFSPLFPCVGVLFIIFMFSRLVLEMAWPRATIMLISLTDIGFGDHRHAPVNPDRVIRPFQYSLALTELDLEHQARKFSHNGRGGFRN